VLGPGDLDSLFFSGRAQRLGARLWRLFHGFAERVERYFKLAHQDVRRVAGFLASLYEALRHLACFSKSLKNRRQEYRAVVQMCSHARDLVCAAPWTLVFPAAEQVGREFG
jgi:hypothetical protein